MKSSHVAACIVSVVALCTLSGCATDIMASRKPIQDRAEIIKNGFNELSAIPPIQKVKLPPNALIVVGDAKPIPSDKDVYVDAVFTGADIGTILMTISKSTGLNSFYSDVPIRQPVISSTTAQPAQPAPGFVYSAQTPASQTQPKSDNITMSFQGKVSDFLKTVSRSTGWTFSFENNALTVRKEGIYNMVLPGYIEVLKEIRSNVEALGGTSIGYDSLTSTLTFQADFNSAERISEFCRKMRENASLITMRILLVNVKLESTTSAGIDWTKFVLGYGTQSLAVSPSGFGNRPPGATSSSGANSSGGSGSSELTPFTNLQNEVIGMSYGAGVIGNDTGSGIFIDAGKFTLGAVLNYIEDYGRFSIMQNAFIESLSGTKGGLSVLTETPYVSEVSLTALSTNATSATQAAKTATAKSGVELEVVPYYSKKDGTLSMALKVTISTVTRLITLSAGNQLGTITQPETTLKTVNTYLRMTPAQVAVVGGLTIESVTDNAAGLPADNYLAKTATTTKQKEELVIIVKPAVIEFSAL